MSEELTLKEALAVVNDKNFAVKPKDQHFVIVQKYILNDKRLTGNEKLLVSLITSLDRQDHCYATNQYFADILGVTARAIRKMINRLCDLGMIEYDGKFKNRRILISNVTPKGIKKSSF